MQIELMARGQTRQNFNSTFCEIALNAKVCLRMETHLGRYVGRLLGCLVDMYVCMLPLLAKRRVLRGEAELHWQTRETTQNGNTKVQRLPRGCSRYDNFGPSDTHVCFIIQTSNCKNTFSGLSSEVSRFNEFFSIE